MTSLGYPRILKDALFLIPVPLPLALFLRDAEAVAGFFATLAAAKPDSQTLSPPCFEGCFDGVEGFDAQDDALVEFTNILFALSAIPESVRIAVHQRIEIMFRYSIRPCLVTQRRPPVKDWTDDATTMRSYPGCKWVRAKARKWPASRRQPTTTVRQLPLVIPCATDEISAIPMLEH
jgi:hypothetical protein